jgi:hypothetical protein
MHGILQWAEHELPWSQQLLGCSHIRITVSRLRSKTFALQSFDSPLTVIGAYPRFGKAHHTRWARSVSLKSVGKNTIEETDKRDGKVISVARWTVGSDGKTMTLKVEDKLHGSNSQFTATKQ